MTSAAMGPPSLPLAVSSVAQSHRLVLCPQESPRAGVDGVWWPRSSDLKAELPDLVAVFSRWLGTVHRVVYDPAAWMSAPSRIIRHNSAVTVDPYQMVDRELVYLMGTHSRDAVLFAVPSSCTQVTARRVLRRAERSATPLGARELRQICAESAQVDGL
ncbi:DUF5994 family protein [Mycolicibacterium confluentis]|uniref:Uncharacterized protein n=1 Tax=Mycolicibacterium confluentis TaxID=28047 RepID=A0A7I7XVV8_9MYCO|nr:DUF5994 family protein [Mycolicibacterium confluentis]MCV7321610.1 hypothetical protein [Mycolicibacterium confluentis]ORV26685.1 hypothetical protein AWB99_20865 [Mycolicibacterium confluentis]BBZ33419.1 hypothetical protein MCNF_20240 [Mycolicibacterium confluentis]